LEAGAPDALGRFSLDVWPFNVWPFGPLVSVNVHGCFGTSPQEQSTEARRHGSWGGTSHRYLYTYMAQLQGLVAFCKKLSSTEAWHTRKLAFCSSSTTSLRSTLEACESDRASTRLPSPRRIACIVLLRPLLLPSSQVPIGIFCPVSPFRNDEYFPVVGYGCRFSFLCTCKGVECAG
jgi:hypothetical protein